MRYIFQVIFILACIYAEASSGLRFQRITVEDGLSQSAIKSVLQDEQGFMWFGTRDGLNRYNGHEFDVFQHIPGDSTSILNNYVNTMSLDSGKGIWVGVEGGLSFYDYFSETFKSYPTESFFLGDPRVFIHDIHHYDSNTLLLATSQGLVFFDNKKGLYSIPTELEKFYRHNVMSILPVGGGQLWIARANRIDRYDRNFELTKSINISNKFEDVFRLIKSIKNGIYICSRLGLFYYDLTTDNVQSIETGLKTSEVYDVLETEDGLTYAASRVLLVFNKEMELINSAQYVPGDLNSLSGNAVERLFQSDDGLIWACTNGYGINKYNPKRTGFTSIGERTKNSEGLSSQYVSSIYTEDDTSVWIGTSNGLNYFDRSQQVVRNYYVMDSSLQHLHKGYIHDILPDKNLLWLGVGNRLVKFNTASGEWKMIEDVRSGLGGVVSLEHYQNDLLLIGRNAGGVWLYKKDSGYVKSFEASPNDPSSLSSNEVTCLLLEKEKQILWVGTEYGLNKMDLNDYTITNYYSDPDIAGSLGNNHIKCLYRDSKNKLWIGTWGGGMSVFDDEDETFSTYTVHNGLVNNVVYGILETSDYKFWLSTNKGLSLFDVADKKFFNFSYHDGLQSNEFNTNAFFKSANDVFYFGGVGGLTYFTEGSVGPFRNIPNSYFSNLYINNEMMNPENGRVLEKSLYYTDSIVLRHRQNSFSISYDAIDFINIQYGRFKFRLKGFEEDWMYVDKPQLARYTSLPPGNYVFQLRASNPHGLWEEDGVELHIKIKAPFWQQAWFYFTVPFLLIIMAYFLGRYRINRIRRARDKLEKTVAERTREIQKMNEEIAAQNEELVSQSESIYAQNQELSNQKEALQKMKNTLELEVDKRTFELKKLNTELIDQNSKLEQFTFITAHNLKAPIAQLKGLLSLIPDNQYQDQMNREVMKRLKHSAVHLDEVVSDLNNILNIKRSATEISEKVSLDNQLNKTLRALSDEFKENEITVYKSVAEGLFIRGVKAYVQSIFYNLLHNAIKYASKERDSFVKINMKRVGDQIVIKISDNGIGIDMKYAHDKIFQLYQRFNTEYQGKGFGLFLVKSQIEVMDGNIEVSSELDKGTSFTIIFPAFSN